jgi:hypothetical protein
MKIVHIIPVGGDEPVHDCNAGCWCHPLLTDPEISVHHAKDLREVRERQNTARPQEKWIRVNEIVS